MKTLLMFFGYSAYQAGCIAPMMWFLFWVPSLWERQNGKDG